MEVRGFVLEQGRSRHGGKWIINEPLGEQQDFIVYDEFKLYAERVIRDEEVLTKEQRHEGIALFPIFCILAISVFILLYDFFYSY
jgi:hypothetical protein